MTGMEDRVVTQFVALRGDLAPRFSMLEKRRAAGDVKRATKAVLLKEGGDAFEVAGQGVVVSERDDAAGFGGGTHCRYGLSAE